MRLQKKLFDILEMNNFNYATYFLKLDISKYRIIQSEYAVFFSAQLNPIVS